jgi:hypothetical protein
MKRIGGKLFWCEECEELYRVDGDTQKTVKNKEKHLKELADKLKSYTGFFREIAEKCGVSLEDKEKTQDDDEGNAFSFMD